MILSNEYGIDPGSYAIKIYDRDNERFYSDHNALACDMAGHVIAYGQSAYEMKGSTPRSITIKNSVQAGKITDVLLLEAIIEPLLYRDRRFLGIRPSIYFSVPADMTEIERRAYASISKRGKLKNCNVFLVERAFADAFALGLSVKDAKGIMVLNIGSSQTTASVISNGRIILERSLLLGGEAFTTAVITSIRKKNNLAVGYLAGEQLKKEMCSLSEDSGTGRQIAGLDTVNGLPRDGFVTGRTVTEAVRNQADELILQLEDFIHRIPPQVLEYVRKEGIYLTGGSVRMNGLCSYLSQRLKLPVIVSELCEYSTVRGLKEIMTNVNYQKFAVTPVTRQKK